MTTDAISRWLNAPAALPESVDIDAGLRTWPWFVPLRLMEAKRAHHQAPFSAGALNALRLYGTDWLSCYRLLTQEEKQEELQVLETEEVIDFQENTTTNPTEAPETAHVAETVGTMPEQATDPLIQPLFTEDYFLHQGVTAPEEPQDMPAAGTEQSVEPQTLMVMMSFAEWLNFYKTKSQKEQEEEREKRALRSMWQQEKLAAALEDEPDEIPEDVFEMAVSSITREDDIVSEPLAEIYERQEKWSAAAEMYRKLALKYPAKSTYFASRAEAAKKRLL